MTAVAHGFADLGDVRLHYVTAGDDRARPVVLLHGYPQTWFCWREVMGHLVAAGFRCIAPDLRGLGDSSRPLDGYDKKTLAGDVRRLVVDRLGVDSFVAVGHDWGGAVAFALAANHARHVSHLVVADVAIPGDGQPDLGQGGRRWHHTFLRTPDLPEALISGREEVFLRWFYENYGAHPAVIAEEAVTEYLRTYRTPGALRCGFAYYRAVPEDIRDNSTLDKLTVPTLALGGAVGFGRGAEVGESLRRMAVDVTGLVIDDCGHWIPEEKPREMAAAIVGFVERR